MSNPKKNRTTLQDIADRVGITKMTVSRYLRNPDAVAEKTRDKIAAAIEALGYIENKAPAMLSKSSSRAIGVLLPSLSNQIFAAFVQGIEAVTNAHGYEILLAHFGYDENEEEQKIASLLSYHVDGLILTESHHTPRTLQMIQTAGLPVVETMEIPAQPIDMAVGLDHVAASYDVVKRMLDSGKRNIAYFGARLDTRTRLRMQGYDNAMQEAGLAPIHMLTEEHSSFSLAETLLARALDAHPDLDGVFCTNDDIATGTLLSALQRGIKVPEQLAVVGYNALDIGQSVRPTLTSVDTPRYEIGKKSAELLLARLKGEPIKEKVIDLGYRITHGESL
ncbi:LacI family DNA-binding transcriptional regulator [Grimontia hollisae]|uniref:Gluconate utilization system Gnt-I transcriptional repressor n=1 Tax=Grimontia hollisae CIP 101886 TaxID=675812 RepID=D0I415_GRIHO|nr:LacI family DNA-binding transcriptional regulator [Grimontia hollisae]AMG30469.1 LacI family DNA-binding transcriptional regulator [Grimontia hollisae]EEY73793.1 gluconate utilization system Gnt-I transcriptional repressor [Grimontia hollisae CIP 101886]STO41940.1 Gluconate utilization system GNT-I transcriptional repressor [Grimontia hollisae]